MTRSGMTANPHMTAERWRDRQYGAAFTIFEKIGRGQEYVVHRGIEKLALLQASRCWSHGEQILVKVALDLFDPGCVEGNGFTPAGLGEAVSTLDNDNLSVLLRAIAIARGWRRAEPPAGIP